MTQNEPDGVLRTLIATVGPLAQAVGEAYVEQMAAWNGPEAAIAVVPVAQGESLDTTISQALTRISPPNLAAMLSAQGWALSSATDLSLILLMDVVPDAGETAVTLLAQTTAVIYRHLGIEAASLLIWLAGETAEMAGPELLSTCLSSPIHVTRGMVVWGLCNEAGLRLPDEAALCSLSSHLLWCLTVMPLRHLPEQAVVQNSQLSGGSPLFSLGLAGWQWSPAATQAAFARRWLDSVLAHWLSATPEITTSAEITTWLQSHALRPDDFAVFLLKEEERQPPPFPTEAWRMPWPWEIEAIVTETLFVASVDGENLVAYQEFACLRLAEPLQRATAALQKQAQMILDENPVGGISRACNWLHACLAEWDRLIEQLLDQEENLKENLAYLGGQHGQQERQIKQWLAAWPPARWQFWLALTLRPWRWPALVWRYRQWQTNGPQLSRLLKRRSAIQRQLIINQAMRQALVELGQITRRLYSQVDEVGQMLQYLAEEMVSQQPVTSSVQAYELNRASPDTGPLVQLPIPEALYEQLVGSAAAEAVMAANACGGLGQHVCLPDEKIGDALQRLAVQRLASVWQLTAVDALLSWKEDADQMQASWQEAWAAARPLWRVDETRLDEATRAQNGRITALCGAAAPALGQLLPELDEAMVYWESADREHLWVVRVRAGLG